MPGDYRKTQAIGNEWNMGSTKDKVQLHLRSSLHFGSSAVMMVKQEKLLIYYYPFLLWVLAKFTSSYAAECFSRSPMISMNTQVVGPKLSQPLL